MFVTFHVDLKTRRLNSMTARLLTKLLHNTECEDMIDRMIFNRRRFSFLLDFNYSAWVTSERVLLVYFARVL